jgi:transcriptional regulator with XRE-family HTH domain
MMTNDDEPQTPPGSFIRAWRLHRGMASSELAARVDVHRTQLHRVERGERPYTREFLEKAAAALGCTPGQLIDRHPNEGDVLDNLTPDERSALVLFLEPLRRSSSPGGNKGD